MQTLLHEFLEKERLLLGDKFDGLIGRFPGHRSGNEMRTLALFHEMKSRRRREKRTMQRRRRNTRTKVTLFILFSHVYQNFVVYFLCDAAYFYIFKFSSFSPFACFICCLLKEVHLIIILCCLCSCLFNVVLSFSLFSSLLLTL